MHNRNTTKLLALLEEVKENMKAGKPTKPIPPKQRQKHDIYDLKALELTEETTSSTEEKKYRTPDNVKNTILENHPGLRTGKPAKPDKTFWDIWHGYKQILLSEGFRIFKKKQQWYITWIPGQKRKETKHGTDKYSNPDTALQEAIDRWYPYECTKCKKIVNIIEESTENDVTIHRWKCQECGTRSTFLPKAIIPTLLNKGETKT